MLIKNKKWIFMGVVFSLFFLAENTFALTFSGLITNTVTNIFKVIIGFSFTLAIFFFLWQVFLSVWGSEKSSSEKAEARKGIVFGIIALFILGSLWGLINVLSSSLSLDSSKTLTITVE